MFEFWDNLPVVGPYFAGVPEIVKAGLTGMLILIVLVIGVKALKGKGPSGGRRRRSRREREEVEETGPGEELETGLEGEMVGTEGLEGEMGRDLGLFEEEKSEAGIESLLAGQPITPESELFPEEVGETKQEKKAKEKEEKKKEEKVEAAELPTEIETVLEEEPEEKPKKKEKPVLFEEIDLAKMGEKHGRKTREVPKREEKPKEEVKAGSEKPLKRFIMESLDTGKNEKEIISEIIKRGIGRGKARVLLKQVEELWKTKRKPLLDKKKELEHQKKILQYKYLKMQISEDNFKKLMNDIQKQLIEIESKLKASEKLFND